MLTSIQQLPASTLLRRCYGPEVVRVVGSVVLDGYVVDGVTRQALILHRIGVARVRVRSIIHPPTRILPKFLVHIGPGEGCDARVGRNGPALTSGRGVQLKCTCKPKSSIMVARTCHQCLHIRIVLPLWSEGPLQRLHGRALPKLIPPHAPQFAVVL